MGHYTCAVVKYKRSLKNIYCMSLFLRFKLIYFFFENTCLKPFTIEFWEGERSINVVNTCSSFFPGNSFLTLTLSIVSNNSCLFSSACWKCVWPSCLFSSHWLSTSVPVHGTWLFVHSGSAERDHGQKLKVCDGYNYYLCTCQRASWTYPPQVFTTVHLFNKIIRSGFTINSPLFQNNWVKIHHRKNKVGWRFTKLICIF